MSDGHQERDGHPTQVQVVGSSEQPSPKGLFRRRGGRPDSPAPRAPVGERGTRFAAALRTTGWPFAQGWISSRWLARTLPVEGEGDLSCHFRTFRKEGNRGWHARSLRRAWGSALAP